MRKYTNMVLDMIDEGMIDAKTIAEMCLQYMGEADVEDMCRSNDILPDEEYQDDYDGQPDEAQEWESFDPDC